MSWKIITEETGKLTNKKILLRLDLNVPISDGKIVDNFKIEKVLTTIGFLQKEGAKIIILSHLGGDGQADLLPVCEYLKKFFAVSFITDIFSDEGRKKISGLQAGEIVILENLRRYAGEQENNPDFTKRLASLGDLYVNEAFAVSHRCHSSIVGLPQFLKSFCGPEFASEIKELANISQTGFPRLFILGGNKLQTKIPFIEKFLEKANFILVGGALANDFFKAQGLEIGESLASQERIVSDDLLQNKKIILPEDVVVAGPQGVSVKKPKAVKKGERIVDVGPQTMGTWRDLIKNSKFALWNGPLGDYLDGFSEATFELIRALTDNEIEAIAGGGDTEHCISQLGLEEKFDFISTGGGALLEFVAEGTLAGIEALNNSPL